MAIKRVDGTQWGRYYEIDGIKYPSVTTVLDKWDKGGLLYWNGNTVANYAREEIKKCTPYEVEHRVDAICDEAIKRPNIIRDTAASRGIYYHDVLEAYLKGEAYENIGDDDPLVPKLVKSIEKWRDKWEFQLINGPNGKPLVETVVYSERHGFAGTVDIIGKIEGNQLILIDFKTGNSVRKSHATQIAAYAGCYAEMAGEWPNVTCILHLLPSGNVKMKHILDQGEAKEAFEAFLHLFTYYQWDAKKKGAEK